MQAIFFKSRVHGFHQQKPRYVFKPEHHKSEQRSAGFINI
jgi:hypothetical protein